MSCKARYVADLADEISNSPAKSGAVDTVYIGGGTPSCLTRDEILRIFEAVYGTFNVENGAEITVEANPESCGDDFARACVDCGVNRVSMGLQSSDDEVLKRVGRVHCYSDFVAAAERLRSRGIKNISSDVILGLPGQTADDIHKSAETFSKYCTHASVYALTVEEGTPLYASGFCPDDDGIADMYDLAVKLLCENGFSRYEVSNFAKCGMRSRHNQKYWSFEPYLAFGVAAHGFDGERLRYAHTNDVNKYIRGSSLTFTELSDKDVYNEYVMLALRTERGIDTDDFASRFGVSIEQRAGSVLDSLTKSGLVVRDGKYVRISPDKMFVMNGIIEELMI